MNIENNYIEKVIPFFFLFIGIEIVVSLIRKKKLFGFHDSINDLSCGITQQIIGIMLGSVIITAYIYLYESYKLFTLSTSSVILWVICFFAVDLGYYWFHRTSHTVNIIWGSHIPHHQSEEYNLAVALRQGAFEQYFSFFFYLPLALIGFPPVMAFVCKQFNSIYQFFVHTRAVKSLGPVEYIMNTPSHHRVHHGKNPKYIDKNFSGVFIIWDKLFGTFQKEEEEVVYGTVKPLKSWNPLWANFEHWLSLAVASAKLKGFDKVRIWFMQPGWLPGIKEIEIPEVQAETYSKFETEIPKGLDIYAFSHFIITLVMTLVFLEKEAGLLLIEKVILAAFLVASLVNVGAMLELKKWAFMVELSRYIILLNIALYINSFMITTVTSAIITVSFLWFIRYRKLFQPGFVSELS